jgi:hypothetical protein
VKHTEEAAMSKKTTIAVGIAGLVVGFLGGAVASWGLDPADEPPCPDPQAVESTHGEDDR